MNTRIRTAILLGLLLLAPASLAAPRAESPPLFSGPETLTLRAGQFAAFRWIPDRQGFVVESRPAPPLPLPRSARAALRRVPAWLRDATARQLRALTFAPIRVEKGPARPAFRDVNGDGRADLVVRDGEGRVHAFAAPRFAALPDYRPVKGAIVPEIENPARGDVTGDGRLDEVKGTEDGRILYRRNRGGFLSFRTAPKRFFPERVGLAARPAAAGKLLLVGNLEGEVRAYRAGKDGVYRPRRRSPSLPAERLPFAAPALGELTGKKRPDVVLGGADGTLHGPGLDPERHRVGSFASPALADLDGDGDLDLVCGAGDGTLTVFTNEGGEFGEGRRIEGLDVGDSSAPAAGDVDGDGDVDLVVGCQAGTLHLFLGPDFEEDPDAFAGLDLGEVSAPALNGKRLIVGRLDGDLIFYDLQATESGLRVVERGSWDYEPDQRSKDLEAYYERVYYGEWEELRGAIDAEAAAACVTLLAEAPAAHVDEIAFVLAHTPAEVLRAMVRMGEAGLLAENARLVYEMAKKVDYAKLVEEADGTTIAYATETGWRTAPRDLYYWWVVHPRILYEIPSRIDDSWWRRSAKERGLSDSDWWKHEPEEGVHAPGTGAFWRASLPGDRRFGVSLLEAVKGAKSLREAHREVHRFLAKDSGGAGIMRFGYETQDLQPWLIYAKHYGSCGEHSILGAAAARTFLIPASVVGCRGEDHQWNEFWDVDGRWHHWDPCGKNAIDTPWGSSEGLDHRAKTVSTVTRWRGDDFHDATTTTVHVDPKVKYTTSGSGYTDVARVTVRVADPGGRPVDGALVVVRSHWDRRNLVSDWGYTDGAGEVRFGLGYEPHGGYTIEALTPLGATGVMNFPVVENEEAELLLTTPEEVPAFARDDHVQRAEGEGEPGTAFRARLLSCELTPPNYITARPYRVKGRVTNRWGYRGTHRGRVPIEPGGRPEVLIFTPQEYGKFLEGEACVPTYRAPLGETGLEWPPLAKEEYVVVVSNRRALFAEVRVELSEDFTKAVPPSVTIAKGPYEVDAGRVLRVEGTVRSPGGTAEIEGEFLRDVTIEGPDETGRFQVVVDAGAGGPCPPGDWPLTVRARDRAGRTGEATVTVRVRPARIFTAQKIRQDDPENPLRGVSWVYGPFDLSGKDRFLLLRTKSATPGFDMDLYLYFDRNGNGRIDGPGEQLAKSTSPTATERIYREKPAAGTYWVYCQGWKVEGDHALLDVEIYPPGTWRFLGPFSPVGPVPSAPAEIVAGYQPFRSPEPGVLTVRQGGAVVPGETRAEAGRMTFVPARPLVANVPCEVTAAHGGEERSFTFTIDTVPPVLTVRSPAPRTIRAAARDAAGPVRVTVRLPDGRTRRLKAVGEGEFRIELGEKAAPKGEHELLVTATDEAGLTVTKTLRVRFP